MSQDPILDALIDALGHSDQDYRDYKQDCEAHLDRRVTEAKQKRDDMSAALTKSREVQLSSLQPLRDERDDVVRQLDMTHSLAVSSAAAAGSSVPYHEDIDISDIVNINIEERTTVASRIGLPRGPGAIDSLLTWARPLLLFASACLVAGLLAFAYLGVSPKHPFDHPLSLLFAAVCGMAIPLAVAAFNSALWPNCSKSIVYDIYNAFIARGHKQSGRESISDETRRGLITTAIGTGAVCLAFTSLDAYAMRRLTEANNPFSQSQIIPVWASLLLGSLLGCLYVAASAASAYSKGYRDAAHEVCDGEAARHRSSRVEEKLATLPVQNAIQAISNAARLRQRLEELELAIKTRDAAAHAEFSRGTSQLPAIPTEFEQYELDRLKILRKKIEDQRRELDLYRRSPQSLFGASKANATTQSGYLAP